MLKYHNFEIESKNRVQVFITTEGSGLVYKITYKHEIKSSGVPPLRWNLLLTDHCPLISHSFIHSSTNGSTVRF